MNSQVLALLRQRGVATAHELRHALGLPVEAVYAALVSAESAGLVRVRVQHIGKRVVSREWVAA